MILFFSEKSSIFSHSWKICREQLHIRLPSPFDWYLDEFDVFVRWLETPFDAFFLIWRCRSLSFNMMTGSIPEEISTFENLYGLWVHPIVFQLVFYVHLRYLDNNQFTGTIPDSLGDLTSLNFLYLWKNWKIPPHYQNNTFLLVIWERTCWVGRSPRPSVISLGCF